MTYSLVVMNTLAKSTDPVDRDITAELQQTADSTIQQSFNYPYNNFSLFPMHGSTLRLFCITEHLNEVLNDYLN